MTIGSRFAGVVLWMGMLAVLSLSACSPRKVERASHGSARAFVDC